MCGNIKRCVVLFLLGVWALSVQPAAAQPQTLSGWFTFIVADYPTEAGLTSETTYFLTEDSGERHELLLDAALLKPLGSSVAVNLQRVTVEGEWEGGGPDGPAQFHVSSIELAPLPLSALPSRPLALEASPDETAPLASSPRSAVTGSQAWVTILCRFGDATDVTPYPVSHYGKLTGTSEPGLDHYWREVSYGNINLTGSVVVGWYNLPRSRPYYSESGDVDLDALLEDCTAVADADVFFPDFYGINLISNQDYALPPLSAWGGIQRLTKDGQTRSWGITWLSEWTHENQGVWAHEMGHALGLPHSSGPHGPEEPAFIGAKWDVMGSGHYLSPSSEWLLGVHAISYHKDLLGWIPADRKYVAPPDTTRTITLEQLAQPSAEGYLMAQSPIGDSPTDFYTIEARLFTGYDDGIPGEAVVIHKVDTTLEDFLAQVVDIDNNGDPNDEGAMWTVGEIFTDLENNLQVSIDAAYAIGYRVTINTNPDTFSTCIALLSPSSHIFGPGGDGARVRVEAGQECEWSATSNTDWIRVTAGGNNRDSGSVHYTVAANPSPAARTGTLTIGGWTFTVTQAGANAVLVEHDMESGTNGWGGNAPWALTTASAHSGKQAWTDSPGGHYQNNLNIALWSPSPPFDLTKAASATLTFWHRYAFASGDRGNVWVCPENEDCIHLKSFTGSQAEWQQVSLDLTPFVGQSVWLNFQLVSDATETADGWYIDDVAVFSTDFVSPATLENPQPASFQSGIGIISGWACHAHEIVIELAGTPVPAAYGTPREDTRGVCEDSNNGFSLLVNWNNLGPGEHEVRALADGVEFARTTVRVATLGEEFLRGVSGTFPLSDFPYPGDTTVVQWNESRQNFVITDGQSGRGGGHDRAAGLDAILENPSLGSSQSGIGIISGWACEAREIVIELAGTPVPAAYGTPRGDTQSVCGNSNNGFVLLMNWNNLGPGEHAIRALADGVEFARTTVRVTTLGEEFLRGVSGTFPLPDFPHPGDQATLRWEESLQNFVIIP